MPTNSPVEIRRAVSHDVPVLAQHEPRQGAHLVEQHVADQEQGSHIFATAWRGDSPLGWCVLSLADSDLQPELAHLWVFPEFRRQGVGRALTQWLENEARERGFSEVFLLVDPNNERAIPLYLDLDYSPTGDHQQSLDDVTGRRTHMAIYRKSLSLR